VKQSSMASFDLNAITRADVPLYLQGGAFYRALNSDEGDSATISVPTNCMKSNTSVANAGDLVHLLNSLRFWAVDELPLADILPFLLAGSTADDEVMTYVENFSALPVIIALRNTDPHSWIARAITLGSVKVVAHLDGCKRTWPGDVASELAAKNGHLNMLKYILSRNKRLSQNTASVAVDAGHADCLQFAYENGGCWNPSGLSNSAVQKGHLQCVKYLHSVGLVEVGGNLCSVAADNGSIEMVMYLRSLGCTWSAATTCAAARNGHLECLQYLHAQGCPWGESTCLAAAANGHKHCLEFARAHGCPWSARTMKRAVAEARVDMVQYLHAQGCPWDDQTCLQALRELYDQQPGHFDCLRYLHAAGCPFDKTACLAAAKKLQKDLPRMKSKAGLIEVCDMYIAALETQP